MIGVNIELTRNNDLLLSLDSIDEYSIEELSEYYNNYGEYETLAMLLEPYSTNGSYTFLQNGDYGIVVGLIDAPIIAESLIINDDGTGQIEGRLWYYPNYMIMSCIQELIDYGYTTFKYE